MDKKPRIDSVIEVKVSRKDGVELIPVKREKEGVIGHVPKIKINGGPKLVAVNDMKVFGLYETVRNLIKSGKLRKFNANGSQKLDNKKNAVYFEWDRFTQLREF